MAEQAPEADGGEDGDIEGIVGQADDLLRKASGSRIPLLRSYAGPLRMLGELKVESNALFERTGNALKLVGDQYLARVYRLLASRFHLPEWEQDVKAFFAQKKVNLGGKTLDQFLEQLHVAVVLREREGVALREHLRGVGG